MSLLDETDQSDLEDDVRTLLHRLAADVHDDPPPWDELIARPVVADVTPLTAARSSRGRHDRDRHDARERLWRRPRLSLAAAAVIAVAIGGSLLVERPDGGEELPPAEVITALSPTDPDFDAEAAAAVWTTGLGDPVAAAAAYLGANGVATDASVPGAALLQLRADDGTTAAVDWTLPDGTAGLGGTVYLRAPTADAPLPGWTVVGAAAEDVSLEDVSFDGDRLEFTVERTLAAADQLVVGVWVDGAPVALGGEAVAQAGAADVSLGELLDIGADAGATETLALPVGVDDTVTLRVAHVLDGTVLSVTQMVVALPEADAAANAGVTGSTGADASGTVDAAPGDASVGAGAGTTPVDGVEVPLPDPSDVTLPTVPGVPTPTLPALPLPPVPTTLPAPPADLVQ